MVWPMVASAGISLIGGLFGRRSANKAAARQQQMANMYEQRRQTASTNLGQGMRAMPQALAGAYQFRPVTSRTPFGSAGFDEETGEAWTELSPELQRQQSQYGNLAQQEYQGLMGLDRNAMAQSRVDQLNQLQRPGDIAQEGSLIARMKRMGMMGAANQSGSNAWIEGLASARNTRGLQQAYDATSWVEDNITNRMRNMQGLYGAQNAAGQLGFQNFEVAGAWTDRARRAQMDQAGLAREGYLGGLQADYNAYVPGDAYMQQMAGANANRMQGEQSMIRGATSAGMGMINGMSSAGMFGRQGGPAPISASQPSYDSSWAQMGPQLDPSQYGAYTTPVREPYPIYRASTY